MAQLNVEVIVGLVNRLTAPLQGVQRQLERTGARLSMIGMGASAAGQQMLGPLQNAAEASMRLEDAMADVAKVVDFETPAGLDRLQSQIEGLTRDIPLMASELAQITAAGGQLGIEAPDLPDYTRQVAVASIAFDMLPELAGESFAKLANVYDIPIPAIGRLGDAINHLSNNSAAKASEIVEATQRVGGVARQFGLVETQAAALSATMIALGKTPEVAATGINALLGKLQTASKQSAKFRDALADLGLDAERLEQSIGEDAQAALSGFLDTLGRLDKQSRAGALSDLFGLEYADDISLLAGNLGQYRAALGMVADETRYAGSMQAEFAARSDTTRNKLELIANRLTGLQRKIGDALLPVIVELTERFGPMIDRIGAWIEANPKLAGNIAVVTAAIAGLLVVAGPALMGIAGIMGILSFGAGGLSAALGALGAVAAVGLGPLLALAATIGGAVYVFTHWEETIASASAAWGWLIEKLGFDPVASVAAGWNALADYFGGLWDRITAGFDAGLISGIRNLLATAHPLKLLIDGGQALAGGVLRMIENVAQGILDTLRRILSIDTLREIGANLMRGLIDGIKRAASGAWDAVRGAAAGVVGAAKGALGVQSPSVVFAQIGEHLMAGLQRGIHAATDRPMQQVRRVAGALAAVPMALAPAFASAIPAGPGAPLAELQARTAAVRTLPPLESVVPIDAWEAKAAALRTRGPRDAALDAAMAPSPAASSATRATPGPISVPITINIEGGATRGMDERALAEDIERRLRDAGHDLARRVSSLYDDPDDV